MTRKLHFRPLGFNPTTIPPTLTPKPPTIRAAYPTTPPPSTIHRLVLSLEACIIRWSASRLTLTIYRIIHYPPLAGFAGRQRLDRRFHLASTDGTTLYHVLLFRRGPADTVPSPLVASSSPLRVPPLAYLLRSILAYAWTGGDEGYAIPGGISAFPRGGEGCFRRYHRSNYFR